MEAIQKKIKSYISTAITYDLLMIVLGLILLIFPAFSLDIIRWSLVIGFIVLGAWKISSDFTKATTMSTNTFGGILLIIMGIIIGAHPNVLNIIPIILGIWMAISGFYSLRLAMGLKSTASASFFISLITSLISIAAGVLLIVNPYSSVALTAFIGIMVIIFGVSSLVDLLVFRTHLKSIAKHLKSHKIIDVKIEKK